MAGTGGGGSRLDRLLKLLESGSTAQTREAAARQIGEIAKLHPGQVGVLVRKVSPFLRSKQWETRVAAGSCLGVIASAIKHPSMGESLRADEGGQQGAGAGGAGEAGNGAELVLSFESFDIDKVLANGALLLGSGGKQYDIDLGTGTRAERLERARKNLRKRLGLDDVTGKFMDVGDMVTDEDLTVSIEAAPVPAGGGAGKVDAADLLAAGEEGLNRTLSARERNRLKRKAKGLARGADAPRPAGAGGGGGGGAGAKRARAAEVVVTEQPQDSGKVVVESVPDGGGGGDLGDEVDTGEDEEPGAWPLQALCDDLCNDVLDPAWEVRHGAAVGLREVLVVGSGCAGVVAAEDGRARDGAAQENLSWVQDCIIRMLCVLALDRFGDYVSDLAVAPVRETCAQVLGVALRDVPVRMVAPVLEVVLTLRNHGEWHVRHGGLLGVKYLLAVRSESVGTVLPAVLPAVMEGLGDGDDDVRAVAAEALQPVAGELARGGEGALGPLRALLWDTLLALEELSSSTAAVMDLLARLYASGAGEGRAAGEGLEGLVPRLWPFLRHTLRGVRLSALRTLETVLSAGARGGSLGWLPAVLRPAMRLLFQGLLVEDDPRIVGLGRTVWALLLRLAPRGALVEATGPHVGEWMALAATPQGVALDHRVMLQAQPPGRPGGAAGRGRGAAAHVVEQHRAVVGGNGEDVRMRLAGGHALGALAAAWGGGEELQAVAEPVRMLLASRAAASRQLCGLMLRSWRLGGCGKSLSASFVPDDAMARADELQEQLLASGALPAAEAPPEVPADISEQVASLLAVPAAQAHCPTPGSAEPYSEAVAVYRKLRGEVGALLQHAEAAGVSPQDVPPVESLTASSAEQVAAAVGAAGGEAVASARQRVLSTCASLANLEAACHASVQALLAGSAVASGQLPPKLNPLIQPLMGSLRRESNASLQAAAAEALADLVAACVGKKASPSDKLVKNLCGFACSDPAETPSAVGPPVDPEDAEEAETAAGGARAGGGGDAAAQAEGAPLSPQAVTRRGAELALQALARRFGASVLHTLQVLWSQMAGPLQALSGGGGVAAAAAAPLQPLVDAMQLLKYVGPRLEAPARVQCLDLLPAVTSCCRHAHPAVRISAARCLASMATAEMPRVMADVLSRVMPLLGDATSADARKGAAAAVEELVGRLQESLVPYAVLLLVPLLGRMSDPEGGVRRRATRSFAALLPLLPLARGVPPPEGLDPEHLQRSEKDARFLEQLLDNSKVEDYVVPVKLNCTLRRYQQEGINWLAFLRHFGLHGILADDMGLGKTLQASSILAATTVEARQAHARGDRAAPPLPHLVVCPATLVCHWAYEVEKYLGEGEGAPLRPIVYIGAPAERAEIRRRLAGFDVVVTSYEVLRSDVDVLGATPWGYCVLDEGHMVRNPASQLAKAVMRVQAEHRLVLSGTPIQNSATELWAIFNFLMPGFLGTKRQFDARYGKALSSKARGGKEAGVHSEAGMLAMEALHKQVMPFIMRRTKDQVLSDLPPKIIQDVPCELSPVQKRLYEQFGASGAQAEISSAVGAARGEEAAGAGTHVFQALQYLRKLCSHPLLVLDDDQPAHAKATQDIVGCTGPAARKELRALQHAPKLQALKQLLSDCGIGAAGEEGGGAGMGHRVLVFAQLKSFLDLVERDVLKAHMPQVSYLRLDGSIPPAARFDVVKRFNGDPTIEVLLLTTHVGGLGLNLTTADTVVFLEHDWNPQKDLQAMDRAHRLGQQRTVNVYRLITMGTLEEKIMSLQRFKLDIANAVVNKDNVSLNSMDTGQLLDLFAVSKGAASAKGKGGGAGGAGAAVDATGIGGKGGLKAVLAELGDLWDENLYEEEFDLGQFTKKLG